jgi:hypothetical protein
MISNEQHKDFLDTIDHSINHHISGSTINRGDIEYFSTKLFVKRFNRKPKDIVWVKEGNTPITEFYSSKLMVPWLTTFIKYYQTFLKNKEDLDFDLGKIYWSCVNLLYITQHINGINIIDDTIYLLEHDLEFVRYKLDKKLFI